MKKQATTLLRGIVPTELIDLLDHASSLEFGDIPDYARFISAFKILATTTN